MNLYWLHIFIAMIVSNVCHILIIKKKILERLSVPISTPLFGANKTWRGFIVVPILSGFIFTVVNFMVHITDNPFGIGAMLGWTYMFFELPNSWLKRRLGIAAGQSAQKNALLFMLLDKVDSSFGVSLVSHFIFGMTWLETLYFFLFAVFTHTFFSWLLVFFNIKKRF